MLLGIEANHFAPDAGVNRQLFDNYSPVSLIFTLSKCSFAVYQLFGNFFTCRLLLGMKHCLFLQLL